MKKKIYFLFLLSLLFSLCSCNLLIAIKDKTNQNNTSSITNNDFSIPSLNNPDGFIVTYHCNNGYVYTTNSTDTNKVLKPSNPTKLCSEFKYWSTTPNGTNEYDFDKTINSNIDLYAVYDINFAELTNYISLEIMKSNLRIECKFYNSIYSTIASSLGSGIIIYEDDNYYYCLTNNHVVYQSNYKYSDFYVEDCYEKQYDATLIQNSSKYDLALLKFKKNKDHDLKVINFSKISPYIDDYIISLGEPLGQSNCITYGKIKDLNYSFTPLEESINVSNVTFDVISHSAKINSGSSGGELLDTNMQLVGINFASSNNKNNDEFLSAYSIPINKVIEFLPKSIVEKLK